MRRTAIATFLVGPLLAAGLASADPFDLALRAVRQADPGAGGAPAPTATPSLFGDVTGSMPGLDCLGPCTNKSAMFLDGSIISLSATPVPQGGGQNITFDGWSGDCTGTSTCIITLSKATTVTARFTCHGWCPEQPAAELNNLNGIWGFNTSRLVAVGNAATILQFNGTAWQRVGGITGLQPNVNLMGVGGVAGQAIGFAVGDGGNIVMTQDNGGLWTKNTNGQTKNLRSVWAASGTKAFAVGDEIGPNYAWQEYDGTSWNNPALSSSGIAWNSVWGFGATQYVVVGNMGRIATVDGAAYGLPTANNSSNLHGVWGSRSSSIFIVGASSTILSFDGSTASVVTPPLLNTTLRAIHGASPVDIYVVGDNGTVIASNGSNWNLESFPVKNQLNGVYNFGNGNVYVVGNGGIIYHKRP